MEYRIASNGNDRHPGSADKPWKTLARLNRARLKPGDVVLLEGGKSFQGPLLLTKAHSGLTIGSYGRGSAIIRAKEDGARLESVSNLRLEGLKFRGPGYRKMFRCTGVTATACKNLVLSELDVREFSIHGIFISGGSQILVTHCRAQNNGSSGICSYDNHGTIRDLTLRYCIAENNPGTRLVPNGHSGSGILIAGVEDALIEYCRANRNGWAMPRVGNGPVGIWAWKAKRCVIQHCLSYGNRSPGWDGGGFDFDGGVTDSVMQYNLSYGNIGCGYGMYQFPKAPIWKNNILRFNISYADGKNREGAALHFWTGDNKRRSMSGCRIHNNTFVANVISRASAIRFEEFQVPFPGLKIHDNLLVFRGPAAFGQANLAKYTGNMWWNMQKKGEFRLGDHLNFEAWVANTGQETGRDKKVLGSFQDPQLVLPRSLKELPRNVEQMGEMKAFRLKAGSPALKNKGRKLNLGAWQGSFKA